MIGLAKHVAGHGGALGGDDLLERALRHDALDAVFDDLRETLRGDVLDAAGRLEEARGVIDAPFDVEIDDQAAIVVGEERLALIGLRENAALEFHHLVPRPLPVQAGVVVDADDGAELRADRHLRLRTVKSEVSTISSAIASDHQERKCAPHEHQRSVRLRPSTTALSDRCSARVRVPLSLAGSGSSVVGVIEQLVERQIDEVAVGALGIDQHLVRAREDGLDRLEIEPLARHARAPAHTPVRAA